MAIEVDVERIRFVFPDGWFVTKYDDWAYYRKQFIKLCEGIKAVDLLAIEPGVGIWLIEVKDYRFYPRTKSLPLIQEVAQKVRDSLAGLLAAQFRAVDDECIQARRAVRMDHVRVVLHLELPASKSKLSNTRINRPDEIQKLAKAARCIDPRARVVDSHRMVGIPWQVTLT